MITDKEQFQENVQGVGAWMIEKHIPLCSFMLFFGILLFIDRQ